MTAPPDDPQAAPAPQTITAGGATGVGVASIVAAGSAFIAMFVAARVLGLESAGAADFLVFWSFLFGMYGIVGGIQNEITRAASAPGP